MWVEPHLPRVRSLRVYDSLRARIAFREVCNPSLRVFVEKHANYVNGAWRYPHLVFFIFFEILKFLVVNWLPKSLQPSMTFDLRRHVNIEGKGVCMQVWFKSVVWLLHNYTLWGRGKLPCEAPPKHWAREDTRWHILVWVHGIRTSPFYVYVVCVFLDLKVVKLPHPRTRSPLALL